MFCVVHHQETWHHQQMILLRVLQARRPPPAPALQVSQPVQVAQKAAAEAVGCRIIAIQLNINFNDLVVGSYCYFIFYGATLLKYKNSQVEPSTSEHSKYFIRLSNYRVLSVCSESCAWLLTFELGDQYPMFISFRWHRLSEFRFPSHPL